MFAFVAEFKIVGQIVNFKFVQSPRPRLLVDVAIEPSRASGDGIPPCPSRISTEISNDLLAGQFLKQVLVGEVVELTGTFSQSGYQSENGNIIDTVFSISAFKAQSAVSEFSAENVLAFSKSQLLH